MAGVYPTTQKVAPCKTVLQDKGVCASKSCPLAWLGCMMHHRSRGFYLRHLMQEKGYTDPQQLYGAPHEKEPVVNVSLTSVSPRCEACGAPNPNRREVCESCGASLVLISLDLKGEG